VRTVLLINLASRALQRMNCDRVAICQIHLDRRNQLAMGRFEFCDRRTHGAFPCAGQAGFSYPPNACFNANPASALMASNVNSIPFFCAVDLIDSQTVADRMVSSKSWPAIVRRGAETPYEK